ncbi:MAG: ADP-ribosylglycohydrolase family protein [Gammaproteobacteria bacterium]|nr:ADP-ribosylglycohydrolase family protein [Gammaproteobacteria bacterium]
MENLEIRLRNAWEGRISGCMLGKAVERFSMRQGQQALASYLASVDALPLRDYIPYTADLPTALEKACCRGNLNRSEADDDINYSFLALLMLEAHGRDLSTEQVARTWLRRLPVAMTYTAERAAYRTLLNNAHEWFPEGHAPGFDLVECSDNEYNDWIGAQIRADLYGWTCPGQPELAAGLARADARLSHRGDGVHGAVFVAALGALIPENHTLEDAVEAALQHIPPDSGCAEAIRFAVEVVQVGLDDASIRERYAHLSVVHTVNNLALVVWALLRHPEDYGAAIGDVVAAGLDTDCNGATVGGLWALQGKQVPGEWTRPWRETVMVSLGGCAEIKLDELVARTVAVTEALTA